MIPTIIGEWVIFIFSFVMVPIIVFTFACRVSPKGSWQRRFWNDVIHKEGYE